MDNQNKSIAETILNRIKEGKVKMRPKTYFILKTALIVLGVLFVGLFVLFLLSFISFNLRASGVMFLPNFGFHGIGVFFGSLPWLLILAALLLIVVLEILVRRFSFSYRRPVLYSVLAIVILVLPGSFIIDQTHFHPDLFQRAQEGRLPVAGEFYRDFAAPKLKDVHRGVVIELTEEGFSIETPNGETLYVSVDSKTRFPLGTGIKEGDTVVVLGRRDDGMVQAFGVNKIEEESEFLPHPSKPQPHNILIPHRSPLPLGK